MIAITATVLFALLANLFWVPISGASDEDLEQPIVATDSDDYLEEVPEPIDDVVDGAVLDDEVIASYDDLNIRIGNMGASCSGSTFAVVLENSGAATLEVTVSVDGNATAVSIDGGATKRVFTEAVEDTTYSVVVTGSAGEVLFEDSALRDCVAAPIDPVVSIADSCADGGAVVTITGDPSTAQTVDILVNGAIVETITVAGGETATTVIALAEDETATITVVGSDGTILSEASITHDCSEPAPVVSVVDNCEAGGAVVTITNSGSIDQSVTILVDGVAVETVTVAAGTTIDSTIPMAEDQTAVVTVQAADGSTLNESTITHDCIEPATTATVADSCAAGGAVIEVTNPGTVARTADILVDGAVVETITVEAGATASTTVALAEDATATITVVVDGTTIAESTITHDCELPALDISIASSCADSGAAVTVSNPSDVARSVTINANGTAVETVTVAPGATNTIVVPVAEDGTAVITVTDVDGATLAEESVTLDCVAANPIVTFDVSCADGARVLISNPADVEQTVEIRDGVDLLAIITVPAGASVEQPLDLAEDEPAALSVVLNGNVVGEDTLTVNCVSDDPTVVSSLACETNQLTLQITNVTPNPTTVTITVGNPVTGEPIVQDVTLDGRQTVTQVIVVEEGSTNVVSVAVGANIVFEETVTDDCAAPPLPAPILTATLTHNCSSSVATVSLSNTGNADGVFTVNVNGTVTTIPVAAGVVQLHTFPVAEDGTYQVTVANAAGTVLLTNTFVYNCVPDVTVKPKVELPRTGSNGLYTTVLAGLLLLCLGMIAVDVSRKETPLI